MHKDVDYDGRWGEEIAKLQLLLGREYSVYISNGRLKIRKRVPWDSHLPDYRIEIEKRPGLKGATEALSEISRMQRGINAHMRRKMIGDSLRGRSFSDKPKPRSKPQSRDLTPAEIDEMVKRLREEIKREYGAKEDYHSRLID